MFIFSVVLLWEEPLQDGVVFFILHHIIRSIMSGGTTMHDG